MTIKYEKLNWGKLKSFLEKPFFSENFGVKDSNKIIMNWVEIIKRFGDNHGRVMEVDYERRRESKGERIVGATMKSKDGVIKGVINHELAGGYPERNAGVFANFHFNSEDESLKEEYQRFAKIFSCGFY